MDAGLCCGRKVSHVIVPQMSQKTKMQKSKGTYKLIWQCLTQTLRSWIVRHTAATDVDTEGRPTICPSFDGIRLDHGRYIATTRVDKS